MHWFSYLCRVNENYYKIIIIQNIQNIYIFATPICAVNGKVDTGKIKSMQKISIWLNLYNNTHQ